MVGCLVGPGAVEDTDPGSSDVILSIPPLASSATGSSSSTPTGHARVLLDGISCPNSIAFSRDGRTLYFTDTRQGEIHQATLPAKGQVESLELRPFAAADVAPGAPDGSTVDALGCLWNARHGCSAVVRLDPEGRLMSTLHLPVSQPTACAFGGPDRRTLYVTTARQRLSPAALEGEPMAGDLLAFDVGVAGLPESRFGGSRKEAA